MKAWLLLAAGDDRQHGGNDGYDDEPDAYYTWDSTVPNHGAIAVGDAIVIWDKKTSIGMSVIEEITTSVESKMRHRCPTCGKARFKPRKGAPAEARFRCQECGAEFAQPTSFSDVVTVYRSRHDAAWRPLEGLIPGSTLRTLAVSPESQHSMRSLNWAAFAAHLVQLGRTKDLLYVGRRAETAPSGHVRALTRVRVGQSAFRRKLLEHFGAKCAVVGPLPSTVLEAGHLYSYADLGVHHDHGGLLFRRDIHRLFDLGSLTIEPGTGAVELSPELQEYPAYGVLHGAQVQVELAKAHRDWLGLHWDQYHVAG